MKTVAFLLAVLLTVSSVPAVASAGSSTDAALALGAFAVFNQLARGETIFNGFGRPRVVRERVIVQQAPVVIQSPPAVVYAPAPPPPPTAYYAPPTVVYPHGRWVLWGNQWIWYPNPGQAPAPNHPPAPPPQ